MRDYACTTRSHMTFRIPTSGSVIARVATIFLAAPLPRLCNSKSMPEFLAPGVYVEEIPTRSHPISGVSTSTAGFIGLTREASPKAVAVASFAEYIRAVGSSTTGYLSYAVKGFFDNGGKQCLVATVTSAETIDAGLEVLASEDVSILACPDEHTFPNAAANIARHCEQRKDCVAILQSPQQPPAPPALHPPVESSYAAYYFPWLQVPSLDGASIATVPPCGHIAGIYARTDAEHGVFRPPAGVGIVGANALQASVTESEANLLSQQGVNVLRAFPDRGILVWGSHTTSKDPDWKYVSVRRLMIFIEQSIYHGLQWVVFEPNGPTLLQTVVQEIENFLMNIWKGGGLTGQTAPQAFFVRCDRTTMTQADIDTGRLIALVGVAPVRPAEFVLLQITCQTTGQSAAG